MRGPRMAGALAPALLVLASIGATPPAAAPEQTPLHIPPRPLRAGDVVLRQGTGLWSGLFARVNVRDRRFSHAGIVVGDGRRWRVVHAEADDLGRDGRVRLDDWEVFTAEVPRLAVLRLRDDAAAARAAEAALDLYAAALPFDFDFDLARLDAVYCTELVWRALGEGLGRDPLPVKSVLNGRETILVENFLLDVRELFPVYVVE
jgi:hypothetical protein